MRLYASTTSPFVRKVLLVAHATGLVGRIQFVKTEPASAELGQRNPLNKVPALELDDGTVVYDSRVICEYLDSLHDGPKVFPPVGAARWRALRLQALGDGICDAAVLRLLESRRPPNLRSDEWDARQSRKVRQAVDTLEQDPPPALDIGGLAVLVALAYLDFRFPNEPWREGHPRLAAWFAEASNRDSFRATVPHVS